MNELNTMGAEEIHVELALDLLKNFTFMTFQALLDVAGPIRTMELSRNYFKNHGEAGALNMQKRLGSPSDLPGAFQMGKLVLLWQRRDFVKTVRPDIMYWQNTRCLFEQAPPEFCLLFENVTTPAANRAICPDYEYVCDKMVTQGDPVCSGRGFLRPGSPYYGHLDQLHELELPNISKEEIDFWTIQVLGEEWVMCTKALLDFDEAEKVIVLLYQRVERYGRLKALELKKEFAANENDIAIGKVMEGLNSLFHQVGAIKCSTSQYLEKEIAECPFCNAPKEMGRQFEAFSKGICDELDPRWEVVHTQAMCDGDERCIRVIRKKAKALTE